MVKLYCIECFNDDGVHNGYPFISSCDDLAQQTVRDVLRPLDGDSFYNLYCVGDFDLNNHKVKPSTRLVFSSKECK